MAFNPRGLGEAQMGAAVPTPGRNGNVPMGVSNAAGGGVASGYYGTGTPLAVQDGQQVGGPSSMARLPTQGLGAPPIAQQGYSGGAIQVPSSNRQGNQGYGYNVGQQQSQSAGGSHGQSSGYNTGQSSGGSRSQSQSGTGITAGMMDVYNQMLGINQQHYQNVLNTYNQGQGNLAQALPGVYQGYGGVLQSIGGAIDLSRRSGMRDINEGARQAGANIDQNMVSSGLGNSTVRANRQQQNEYLRGRAAGDLEAKLANQYASAEQTVGLAGQAAQMQGLGMQTGLTQAALNPFGQQLSNTVGSLTGSFGSSVSDSQNQASNYGQNQSVNDSWNQAQSLGHNQGENWNMGQSGSQGGFEFQVPARQGAQPPGRGAFGQFGPGVAGASGAAGASGLSGAAGSNGASGASGVSGLTGTNGIGGNDVSVYQGGPTSIYNLNPGAGNRGTTAYPGNPYGNTNPYTNPYNPFDVRGTSPFTGRQPAGYDAATDSRRGQGGYDLPPPPIQPPPSQSQIGARLLVEPQPLADVPGMEGPSGWEALIQSGLGRDQQSYLQGLSPEQQALELQRLTNEAANMRYYG